MNSFQRVEQWRTFGRQWHLINAKLQCPEKLGMKVAKYLAGMHKPIYHPSSDCGDHVVVCNCKQIAMKAFDWKHKEYYFFNRFPNSKISFEAWKIHQHQPTRIVHMEVYRQLETDYSRRRNIERLHLFPNEEIPPAIMANISGQIEAILPVPKRFEDYSEAEKSDFPALFDWPKDYVVDSNKFKKSS